MCPDGECGVEQQYSLVSPAAQVAIGNGNVDAKIAVDLLDDIDQRRRHSDAVGYAEAKTHGLSGLMVRVLSKDNHLDLVE